ncbi:MAG: hypothetical protein H0U70_12970 [Tatlockia sp.]|nr:hypothetical protein [Tatlockia sp.]
MKFENDFSIAYGTRRSDIWKAVETVLITVVVYLIAFFINPQDPFNLKGPFPWLIFAPIYCSLFYSTIYGLVSLLILFAIMIHQQHLDLLGNLDLRGYIAGSLGLTMLVGLCSSYWTSRIRHIEHLNNYVREHLENLSRDYYLLRISHERIEQSYIVKPLSFRDAFLQIKQDLVQNNCELNPHSAEALLNVFSQYCSINNAALCVYDENNKDLRTMALIGADFFINTSDPLMENAIKDERSTYVTIAQLVSRSQSSFLAVIPLITPAKTRDLIGFIVIKDMPFWSLTHDNLEVFTVFAAYFTFNLAMLKKAEPLINEFPDCPPEFLKELHSLSHLKQYSKVDSSLSCIVVPPGPQQQNIVYILERQKRSLDYIWVFDDKSAKIVMTLMPLTGIEGMLGYKKRIASFLKNDFGLDLNTNGLLFRFKQLTTAPANKQLRDFVEEASHANE